MSELSRFASSRASRTLAAHQPLRAQRRKRGLAATPLQSSYARLQMTYLVTGATGFIGRRLVERLLQRDGEIHILVRDQSIRKAAELVRDLAEHRDDAPARIKVLRGDLRQPLLGVAQASIESLRGEVSQMFHLGALYDMTASARSNTELNVGGTTHAVELARSLQVTRFNHVSSIAVAGTKRGVFSEDDFEVGQALPSPYHRTKFEAERIVREQCDVPWRVYRPSIVLGDSRTGQMDKIDGPYYFFKTLQRVGHVLPHWLPLIGLDLGKTNVVPVDWVAAALDHIAHQDGLDGSSFHLTDPDGIEVAKMFNLLAEAARAPKIALTIDRRVLDPLPTSALSLPWKLPGLSWARRVALRELGIPEEVLRHIELAPSFDTTRARSALAGTPFQRPPAFEEYVEKIWGYWEREMDAAARRHRTLQEVVEGKHILITGASSGIGRAAALKLAAAGAVPLLVARDVEKLEQVRAEIVANGGVAYVYSADISNMDDIDRLVERVLSDHGHVDVLVNNAGRSIRRSIALSCDRFHDYQRTMQLNYFGAVRLILRLLPTMRERHSGHIVNVSSIGVQTSPPRFSAYVASKAALDAFTKVVASEVIGDGVIFTTIHMPLVKTPMIAPTKIYDAFPAISPEQAAEMICEALRTRSKHIGTRLGTFGEVAYAISPSAVDRILHLAYQVFPDSAAAKGERVTAEERANLEQIAMANLMRGVHW